MNYLNSHFNSTPSQNNNREIPKTVMITVILVIASFGMTAIGIFYVLKDKKVINQAIQYLQFMGVRVKVVKQNFDSEVYR